MDQQRLGALIGSVRRRRGLRQIDVASAAGVSDSTVSLLERGHCGTLAVGTVGRIAAVLDVRVELVGYWRGGDAGRLLCWRHSRLAESLALVLRGSGWIVEPEVSFSIYGERGSIDQLALHRLRRHLLVVEIKTELVDVNEMLATFDRKLRLSRTIARERGWEVEQVSGWLIVLDTRTNRRHVAQHRALLRSRFPDDGRQLRPFLREPHESTMGLAFMPDSSGQGVGRSGSGGRSRVRRA